MYPRENKLRSTSVIHTCRSNVLSTATHVTNIKSRVSFPAHPHEFFQIDPKKNTLVPGLKDNLLHNVRVSKIQYLDLLEEGLLANIKTLSSVAVYV